MKRFLLVVVTLAVACEATPIKFGPEPTGSGGASSSTVASSGTMMGASGSGAGLSCDPCENVDGTRIVRQRLVLTSTDGLNRVVDAGYWDKLRDEQCEPAADDVGTQRCFPKEWITTGGQYEDPACSTPVAVRLKSSCTTIKYVAIHGGLIGQCGSEYFEIHDVGPVFTMQLYSKSGNNCVQSAPFAGYEYRSIGPQIPSTNFAEIKTAFVH